MGRVSEAQINEAIANFDYEGKLLSKEPFGSGHINDTYLLKYEISEMGILKVILQRMNREIFTNPVELMENVVGVTTFLRKKIIENGGDPERETLNVIPAKDGKPYYVDSKGEYWRSYVYITDASSYDQVEKPEDFYESAVAFGHFQRMLADYPAETLNETIKGFHDTRARFQVFKDTVAKDVCGRAAEVQDEINFVLAHEDVANVFGELQDKGKGEWKEIDFTKDQLQKPCKDWLKAEGNEPEETKSKEKWHYEKKKVVKFFLKPDKEKTNQRMCLSEHPFGTIKRAMGATYFLLKGMRKVAGEFALFCLGYNLERAKNLLGFQKMMELMEQA